MSVAPLRKRIGRAVPAGLDVHLIVDNYSTHKHAKVKAWLAKRPHWHIHFIPTYSSWLKLVESFFAFITDKAIRRSSFRSVKELIGKIDHFVTQHNENCKPLCGPPRLIPSWPSSKDLPHELA